MTTATCSVMCILPITIATSRAAALDFHALFEQLRADNYQGYVVYEGRIRAEDPAQAYRDSLAWLRTC
ncbi:hypothetical protein ECZU51_19360 [Escherichia coli]|nr:hypothetical protein ECZU51_19360 [Escherichia coli]